MPNDDTRGKSKVQIVLRRSADATRDYGLMAARFTDGARMDRSAEKGRGEFISEPIKPTAGGFDTAAMGRGEPGLPGAFDWRDQTYMIVECSARWKESTAEGGRPGGEMYLRRHCYRLRMDDGSDWTVYFNRQASRSGSPRTRWFLYSISAGRGE